MSKLTWGDGRTDRGCVKSGTQVIQNINSVEPLEQIDTLAWRSHKTLYIGRSSKMSHLVAGTPITQYHWTGIDPEGHKKDVEYARKFGLELKYIFVTPVTERLSRKDQKKGVQVADPEEAHVWTVPGDVIGKMFARRYLNESGYQHFWILDVGTGFVLSPVATPSMAQVENTDPSWHYTTQLTEEEPKPEPVAAPVEDKGTAIAGNKVKVDLMVGNVHVTGTLEFNVAA